MTGEAGDKWRLSAIWLAIAIGMAAIVFARLELSFDLGAFLPRQTTLDHDILIEQLRTGPASRLLVVGLSGAPRDALAEASDYLKQRLSESPAFRAVMNGEFSAADASIPAPVDRYYLLLRDIDFSTRALDRALQDRLRDLAFGGGATLLNLIARDPYLVTLDVLEQLAPAQMSGEMWFADNGSAVLMAETVAPSIDIQAQARAVAEIRDAIATLPGPASLQADITGVGAFSVELQATIRAEAALRSALAMLALLIVLLAVFRSPRLLVLAALPLGMGMLGGITLVSLLFEKVHGITLAFGFTLLGVAVDYPLHLYSHAQAVPARTAIAAIWPTLRLGVISTVVAYLALALSGSQGLAQLGLFTAAGVVVAALVTRTWLPPFLQGPLQPLPAADGAPTAPSARFVVAGVALVAAVVVGYPKLINGLWDDELSRLSPVPEERLLADNTLRSATIAPDLRYQLIMHAPTLDELLQQCERAEPLLATARDDGLLAGWQSACQLVPSRATFERRQQAIPSAQVLNERLADVLAGMPFRQSAFDVFVNRAEAARALEPLTPAMIAASPLASWLDSHLVEIDSQWVTLISMAAPRPDALAERLQEWNMGISLLDLQTASVDLIRDYRNGVLRTISIAALVILALLWYVRGELRQTLWIGASVLAALSVTVAVIATVHASLTVMHVVALLLVLGLGLDYALFLSRTESGSERARTRQGVFGCAASTTVAFGILATSTIPILQYLGLTVAAGSAASYLIAYLGSLGPRAG